MLPSVIIMLFSVFFCYILLKASRSKQNIVLSVFIISFLLNLLFSTLGACSTDLDIALIWMRFGNGTIPIIFGAGYHFLAIYPRRKWIFKKWRASVILCYLPFVPLWYIYIDPRLGITSVEITHTGVVSNRHPFLLIFTILGMVIGIAVLIIDYRLAAKHKRANTIEYGMYRIVSYGLGSLVGGSLAAYLIMILFGITMNIIIPLSFFAMVLFFSIALLKYQLSDLRSRTVDMAASFSAMVALASIGMVTVVEVGLTWPLSEIALFVIGVVVLGALLAFYTPLRRAFSRFLTWLAPEFVSSHRGRDYELEEIYLINCIDGLVMYHYSSLIGDGHPRDQGSKGAREAVDTDLDADVNIVGGMLTAVQEFCKESLNIDDRDYLRVLRFGSKKILIEHGEAIYSVVVGSGEDDGRVSGELQDILVRLQQEHREQLNHWDGDMTVLPSFTPYFAPLLGYSSTNAQAHAPTGTA